MSLIKKKILTEYLYYNVSKGEYNQEIEVRYEDDDIWMTTEMMGKLYNIDLEKINITINNLYRTSVFTKKNTMRKYLTCCTRQRKTINIKVEYYAPQIILSVGFKFDSEKTIQFCKWLVQISTKYRIKSSLSNYGKKLDYSKVENIEYEKQRTMAMNLVANADSNSKIEVFNKYGKVLGNVDLIYFDNKFESILKKCMISYEYKDLLQPIFETDRIEFYSLDSKNNMKYNVGIVVYLDTQIVSYLDQILKGSIKDPNIILPIYSFFQNPISLNANIELYLLENMLETKEISSYVRRNIYSFYYFYYSFHFKLTGKELEEHCERKTSEIYDDFYKYPVSFYTEENCYFSTYVNLMKTILLKYEKVSIKEKIIKLLEFYNEEHYVSDMPNVILAIHYFENKSNLPFFSKIQIGMKESLKIIKNMAWDLRHYYNAIHSFIECKIRNSIIFPMIFSMDKRFNEIRRMLRANCVLVDREKGVVYPYYDMRKLDQYLSKQEQAKYLNIETSMKRDAKRNSTLLRELKSKLETKIVNLLEK